MIRNIFVPISGTDGDNRILETAWAIATAFQAHLEFLHIKITSGPAALQTRHTDFARGAALSNALAEFKFEANKRSAAARAKIDQFCKSMHITTTDAPTGRPGPTASFAEEIDTALERLAVRARHSDLIVFGRPKHINRLPAHLLEHLLVESGRPFLIPADQSIAGFPNTIMICWRESPDAARAAGAALPLLRKANRVIVAAVCENGCAAPAQDFAYSLGWHGIAADLVTIPAGSRAVHEVLADVAQKCQADLLVMGAYGHSRTRELIFGGCTQSMIETATIPIFMLH